jgi:ABC-type phosphate transport system ATPase subunit
MSENYAVRYRVDFGEFTKEELAAGDFGGCGKKTLIEYINRLNKQLSRLR